MNGKGIMVTNERFDHSLYEKSYNVKVSTRVVWLAVGTKHRTMWSVTFYIWLQLSKEIDRRSLTQAYRVQFTMLTFRFLTKYDKQVWYTFSKIIGQWTGCLYYSDKGEIFGGSVKSLKTYRHFNMGTSKPKMPLLLKKNYKFQQTFKTCLTDIYLLRFSQGSRSSCTVLSCSLFDS